MTGCPWAAGFSLPGNSLLGQVSLTAAWRELPAVPQLGVSLCPSLSTLLLGLVCSDSLHPGNGPVGEEPFHFTDVETKAQRSNIFPRGWHSQTETTLGSSQLSPFSPREDVLSAQ